MTAWSVSEFRAAPGRGAELERAYRDGRFLERALDHPGFLHGDFVRSSGDPDVFLAVAAWSDEAAYASWQAAYARLPTELLAALLDTLEELPRSTSGTSLVTATAAADDHHMKDEP